MPFSEQYKQHNGIGQPGSSPHADQAKDGCQCADCKAERAPAKSNIES